MCESERRKMSKRMGLRLVAGASAVAMVAIACRQEPKTPPNMPVPEIQKTENGEPPKTPPSPLTKDAG